MHSVIVITFKLAHSDSIKRRAMYLKNLIIASSIWPEYRIPKMQQPSNGWTESEQQSKKKSDKENFESEDRDKKFEITQFEIY